MYTKILKYTCNLINIHIYKIKYMQTHIYKYVYEYMCTYEMRRARFIDHANLSPSPSLITIPQYAPPRQFLLR